MKPEKDIRSSKKPISTPIAVVGMSCIFPKAANLSDYWTNIKNGVDSITEVPSTHWKKEDYFDSDPKKADHTYTTRGGFIDPVDFNPLEFGVTPNAVEATDTSQLLGLVAAKSALLDAGYGEGKEFNRDKVSVILGVTGTLELVIPLGARLSHPAWRRALKEAGVDDAVANDVVERMGDSYVEWQENSFPGLLGNVAAGRIANRLDLRGTNCVVDAACASSLSALHMALLELSAGRSDMVITGGLDTFNDIFMFMCFSKTMVLSATGDARPFDRKSDGTILGEGLGMLVLKRLDDAERDKDKIYAVIRGIGSSSDGKGNAVYVPSSAGQARAVKNAYEQADVTPDSIELVEAHGTGTKVGDVSEVNALTDVYRGSQKNGTWCALGSVKAQIGHTKAAAGIAGLIKVIMSLRNKVIPPTIKVDDPIDVLTGKETPFYINTESRPWLSKSGKSRRAAVSAFGFGGSNFHCVVEEYEHEKSSIDWDSNIEILCLSGNDLNGLKKRLKSVITDFSLNNIGKEAATSRKDFSHEHAYRLIAVVRKDNGDIKLALSNALGMLESNPEKESWNTPEGVCFSCRKPDGKLGVVFSGQGSQYPGMQRELACQFPQMQEVLAEANSLFAEGNENDSATALTDYIYPLHSFDPLVKEADKVSLQNTAIAQPAIGAVSLGMFNILDFFGVHPDILAGHSYGELTALCAASCLDTQVFHKLSRVRGELMAKSNGLSGAMVAVWSDEKTLAQIIDKESVDLVIANKNAPNQTVLSGATDEIGKICDILTNLNIRFKKLSVSSAFHSPFMAKVAEPFHKTLEESEFNSSKTMVFANKTAVQYPDDVKLARKVLSDQLVSPVEFVKQVENMYEAGVTTFLEVGPSNKLNGLIKANLAEKEHEVISTDASSGKNSGVYDLALTLSRLAVSGFAVDLIKWNEGVINKDTSDGKNSKPSMILPICGSNYVKPKKKRKPKPIIQVEKQNANLLKKAVETSDKNNKGTVSLKQIKSKPINKVSSGLDKSSIMEMYRVTNENMAALQNMQQQTAKLHQQFLLNQESSLQSIAGLMEQQRQLVGLSGSGLENLKVVNESIPQNIAPLREETVKKEVVVDNSVPESKKVETDETVREQVDYTGSENETPVQPETDFVSEVLLSVVSEKTGYPVEMLELDMSLDADLGIDSIKRVEILSAIQEKLPDAPEVKPDHMGVLTTLRHIIDFLSTSDKTPTVKQVVTTKKSTGNVKRVQDILLSVVSEKTGYPVEMLDLDMSLDADLGIDSIKRVEILSAIQEKLPEAPEVKPDHMGVLSTLRHIIDFLSESDGDEESDLDDGSITQSDTGKVLEILLEVVSEKTGYPVEMIDVNMNLDSDLGIDSIKRVEILSALQDRLPGVPEIKPEHMGVLNTLKQISDFLTKSSGYAQADDKVPVKVDVKPEVVSDGDTKEKKGVATVERSVLCPVGLNGNGKEKTFSISAGSEIFITDDGTNLSAEIKTRLEELNYRPTIVSLNDINIVKKAKHIGGLVIIAPSDPIDAGFLKSAFVLLQTAAQGLRAAGQNGGSVFVTVTRLDGEFGLNGLMPKSYPISGGLAGLAKTARHEWPEVSCKALDVSANLDNSKQTAVMIVDEVFTDSGIEVGISKNGRNALILKPQSISEIEIATKITDKDVIIVAGGARGVTAEVSLALAKEFKPVLILLGRSKDPESEPDWVSSLTHEADIKRAIIDHSDSGISPKQVEEQYRLINANREILSNIKKMKMSGSQVCYYSLDVRDEAAVKTLVSEIHNKFGAITGIVHGAGVLADRLIEEKTVEQFDSVYTTKVTGLLNLLNVLKEEDLKFMAMFSSFTGRYGRVGQVDYAVANEVLNKIAQQQSRLRPSCRVVSVNWGPWDGGMVTSSLKEVFKKENVKLIEPKAGANYLIKEMCANADSPVEVVVMGGDVKVVVTDTDTTSEDLQEELSLAFEIDLNADQHPFLSSHVIDNRSVLPMAMIIEWAAQAAIHLNPGLLFYGFNDLRVLKGVTLGKSENLKLQFLVGKGVREDNAYVIPVELKSTGKRDMPIVHARIQILLAERIQEDALSDIKNIQGMYGRDVKEIYNDILFHGEIFQGIEEIKNFGDDGISAVVSSAPSPENWIKEPLRNKWLSDPLVIDCAFQLMILWCFEKFESGSLPCFAGKYRQYKRVLPMDGLRVIIHVRKSDDRNAVADIDFVDNSGKCVARMTEYESVISASLNNSFRKNSLSEDEVQSGVC